MDSNNNTLKLRVKKNTVLKTSPVQSSSLSDAEKANISEGEYLLKDVDDRGNHLLIDLEIPIAGKNRWYVFEEFVELVEFPVIPENTDRYEEPPKADRGALLRIPSKEGIHLLDPIVPGGHFSWAEATKNGTRIPQSNGITDSIILMAGKLEDVREYFGNETISVTSWYRDPATNKAIGGARFSKHIEGHGVDFNVAGLTPKQVQNRLENFWHGGMGYGKSFTHLDNRNYKARWNYGS